LKDSKEVKKLKAVKDVVNELNVSYTETMDNMKSFSEELRSARRNRDFHRPNPE